MSEAMKTTPTRVFPIQLGYRDRDLINQARAAGATTLIIGLPWGMVEPHEAQARKNHDGQSLERLAARGGLSASEAVAVLLDQPYRFMSKVEAQFRLALALAKHSTAEFDPERNNPRTTPPTVD